MNRRYHLQAKLGGENIVALDGSDLKQVKRDLMDLAAHYVQTFPLVGDTSSECFRVRRCGQANFRPVVAVIRDPTEDIARPTAADLQKRSAVKTAAGAIVTKR